MSGAQQYVVCPVFRFGMLAISAIVAVQHIKVVQVPVFTGPLFGKAQGRAKESR
jgi:hypothetical protein